MAPIDELMEYYKKDIEAMQKQIELLKSGGKLQSNDGKGWVDVTDHWIKEYQRRMTELEGIIACHYKKAS